MSRTVISTAISVVVSVFLAVAVTSWRDVTSQMKNDVSPQAFGGIITPPSAPISISTLTGAIPGTENGQTLAWTGSTWALGNYFGDLTTRYQFREEFETGACTGVGKFAGAATGTSTCTFTTADPLHPGIMAITTGTTATEGVRESTPSIVVFGTYGRCVTALWKIHNLSTSIDQYVDRVGYVEPTSNAESVDSVEAVYDFANNGGVHKWALTTSSNSTRTTANCTGSTGNISADTWYKLKLCVNAAASSATLSVNDVLCQTNTTNIPTGTTRATDIGFQHFNASGSTPAAQLSQIDYLEESFPFPTAR